MTLADLAPILAAAFAVPQFVPQVRKVLRTSDTSGVSWSWAALASANNAAWFAYFFLSAYWTALVPAVSASTLAGVLAVILARRGRASTRTGLGVATWALILLLTLVTTGLAGLGALLTVAFLLQMAPSLWTAFRTTDPSGISRGTWLLVCGELSCWLAYGLYQGDQRLIVLGISGIVCSTLMLARTVRFTRILATT